MREHGKLFAAIAFGIVLGLVVRQVILSEPRIMVLFFFLLVSVWTIALFFPSGRFWTILSVAIWGTFAVLVIFLPADSIGVFQRKFASVMRVVPFGLYSIILGYRLIRRFLRGESTPAAEKSLLDSTITHAFTLMLCSLFLFVIYVAGILNQVPGSRQSTSLYMTLVFYWFLCEYSILTVYLRWRKKKGLTDLRTEDSFLGALTEILLIRGKLQTSLPKARRRLLTGIVVFILLLSMYIAGLVPPDNVSGPVSLFILYAASSVWAGLYTVDWRDRNLIAGELHRAREMQMGLMPEEDPTVPGFDVSGVCVPANEVGGDFFDYVWLDKRKTRLGIAVADVSGKAMKAAITAVLTSGMIYRELENNESPKSILRKINRPMFAKLDSRTFTAMSFAVIDTKKKVLKFSNAGQAYPVLKRGKEVMPLEVKGARLPLGVKEDVAYNEMTVRLKKGDMVVFYTDGIPEAMNNEKEFFGFERLKHLLAGVDGLTAKETRERILAEVKAFAGSAPQHDDMTVVVVRVTA